MFNRIAIRKRLSRASPALLAVILCASSGPLAHASIFFITPDCSASGDSLKCHLLQILTLLYVLAGILGFILILVVAIAVRIYLKNKRNRQVRS